MEQVIYRTRLHWINYLRPIGYLMICVILLILLSAFLPFSYVSNFDYGDNPIYHILGLLPYLFIFKLVFQNVWWLISLKMTIIELSKEHLILTTGIFSKSNHSLPIIKYEGLSIYQPLLGRMLNYGSINLTTGEGLAFTLRIRKPYELKEQIQQVLQDRLYYN